MQRIWKGSGRPDDLSRAQSALDKGLAIDPVIVEARVYKAYVHLYQREKQMARLLMAELRAEAPNNASVHFVSGVLYRLDGEYEKALASMDRTLRLNPGERPVTCWSRSRIFMYQGRYDEANLSLEQGTTIEPNHPLLRVFRAQLLFMRGDPTAASELLSDVLIDHPEMDGVRPLLAMFLSACGEHEAARAQLTERVREVALVDHDIPYWLGSAYLMEGERDEAIKWLEKSISLGNENLPWFRSNPVWQPLHNDPRFIELMHRVEVSREKRKLVETSNEQQ